MQQTVMNNEDDNVFWIECSEEWPQSFVVFVQIYSDKTATTSKSRALVAYPVRVVLINIYAFCRGWIVENGNSKL